MNSQKLTKGILLSSVFLSVLSCAIALIWASFWIQLLTHFPPEHVYVEAFSPDGDKIARFSVKYQGTHPWLPADIENHTVT